MSKAPRYFKSAVLVLILTFIAAAPAFEPVASEELEDKSAGKKYEKYIIYDAKSLDISPEELAKIREEQPKEKTMVDSTFLLYLDEEKAEGAPYLNFHWLWEGSAEGYFEVEHIHDWDEFIGFIGTKGREDPRSLDSEIEFWLGGEKYMITKSCLIFVPKGVRHCPIKFTRIGSPVLFFTGGLTTSYSSTPTEFSDTRASERDYAKYFSYGVNPDKLAQKKTDNGDQQVEKKSPIEGIRYLDLDQVEGSPYIDFIYVWSGGSNVSAHPEHSHDWGEVFGFIGTKGRGNTGDLGGEIQFWIGGEKHVITKSSLVWIPPGLKHCPILQTRTDHPYILFTFGLTPEWTQIEELPE
jgi:hypothetical protein